MSNFNYDLLVENEVSKFLDKYLYPRLNEKFNSKHVRINNQNEQHSGIDVKWFNKSYNKQINIDEKTAIHYFNKNKNKSKLKTFAFEVVYEKNNIELEGWLYNKKYKDTTAYLLNWGWSDNSIDIIDNSDNWKNINFDNIIQIESMFIFKHVLRDFLFQNYGINKNNVYDYFEDISYNYLHDTTIKENKMFIKESSGAYFVKSNKKNYVESPLNIIIPKNELKNICEFHTITNRDKIEFI